MGLSSEEKARRKKDLVSFSEIKAIPFRLHRFQPPNDWDPKWYGVPEKRSVPRVFNIHPKGKDALEKSMAVLQTLGWDKHITCVLTGGANVDRSQRGTNRPSPHSIEYGKYDDQVFATAIDIGAILWQHELGGTVTSFTAKRTGEPRMVDLGIFGPDLGILDIVPGLNKPYVVLACVFSQFFGTVLHDKCSGYTGVIHKDHFHLDCTRPVEYRGLNSQKTLVQMAMNLYGFNLRIDGKIGAVTREVINQWFIDHDSHFDLLDDITWKAIMKTVPLEKGQLQ